VPKNLQAQARLQLTQIPHADTAAATERLRAVYQQWCRRKGLDAAATVVIWKMLMIAQQRIRLKNLVKA